MNINIVQLAHMKRERQDEGRGGGEIKGKKRRDQE